MKIIKDAFLKKLSSVYNFKTHYFKDNCLLETIILENDNKSERYALVRIFVDLDNNEIPYSIFINNKKKVVFIDLIAGNKEVIKNHLNFSSEQKVFVSGVMQKKEKIILEKSSFLAAALLSAAEIKTNLDPKKGFEEVERILNPIVLL